MILRLYIKQRRTGMMLLAIGGMLAVFIAVSAMASTSAYAAFWTKANGRKLEAGEERLFGWKINGIELTWKDGAQKYKVLCVEGNGTGKIIGGDPGTDKLAEFDLNECKLAEGPLGCVLENERIPGEEMEWLSSLQVKSNKIFDKISIKKLSFTVEKCNNAMDDAIWEYSGVYYVEMQNNVGRAKTILPLTEVEGDTLESKGDKVLISGEGEMEATEMGEAIGVGLGLHWFSSSGSKVEGSLLTSGSGGTQTLKAVVSGVAITATCSHLDDHGTITNPTSGVAGETLQALLFLGCAVTPSTLKCEIPEAMFGMTVVGELEGTEAAPVVNFTHDGGGTALTSVTLASCTNPALNSSYLVSGSILGKVDNSTSTVLVSEEKGKSSMLSFAGGEATLKGEDTVEMTGGGGVKAEN